MEWEEILKNISQKDLELAEQDLEWILNALEDPTYLMVKRDKSNMFELNKVGGYYEEYIRKVLQEKGYVIVGKAGRAVSIMRERDYRVQKANERGEKNGGSDR